MFQTGLVYLSAYKNGMQELEILDFNTDDLQKIRHLNPESWPSILPDFEFYDRSYFCFPLKVCIGKEIVGLGTSIVFQDTAWLAHIIVAPAFRNKGIGSAIVKELIAQTKAKSVKTILLIATDLGKPVYLKAGFREQLSYRFLKRNVILFEPKEHVYIVNFEERFRSDLQRLDREISGEDRVVLLDDFLPDAKLFVKDNVVHGFYLPSLKEGPIYANLEEAGLALMTYKYASADKAVIPEQNLAGLALLKELGFEEIIKTGIRMILGDDINWQAQHVYSRIGGNFG